LYRTAKDDDFLLDHVPDVTTFAAPLASEEREPYCLVLPQPGGVNVRILFPMLGDVSIDGWFFDRFEIYDDEVQS